MARPDGKLTGQGKIGMCVDCHARGASPRVNSVWRPLVDTEVCE